MSLSFHFRYQEDSLRFLKHMLDESEDEKFKHAMITFDEMALTSTYELDKKTQQLIGPHDKAMVVMMRGLGPK
jgi:hypothetical protein